jgi:hypothetical protein
MEDARVSAMGDNVDILQYFVGVMRFIVEKAGIRRGRSNEQTSCQNTFEKDHRAPFGTMRLGV